MIESWEFALVFGIIVIVTIVRSRRLVGRTRFQLQAITKLLDRERDQLEELKREQQRVLLKAKSEEAAFRTSKELFFEVVSHELRTPLSAIAAATEILSDEIRPESSAHEWVYIAYESAMRLSRTVGRIEELVQLESEAERTGFEIVSVHEVVERLQSCVIEQREIDSMVCSFSWPARDVGVDVHGKQLARMVELLLENALRFSPSGGSVTLELECLLALDEQDDKIRFSVTDQGPGVPMEQRRAIFDSFHQVRTGLSDKPVGMGLGLTICTAIAGNLGCRIQVENRGSKGSRFFFDLPCCFRNATERVDAVGEAPLEWKHEFPKMQMPRVHYPAQLAAH